jgi:hypothetical protein
LHFFARRLSDHVLRSENQLRKSKGWRYWLPGRKLKPAVWTRAGDLLPTDAQYENWISGFVEDGSLFKRMLDRLKKLFVHNKA